MDRGLMDIKAYLPENLWNELLQRVNLTESYLLGGSLPQPPPRWQPLTRAQGGTTFACTL